MKLKDLITYKPEKVAHNFKDLTGTENEYFYIISRAPNSSKGRVRWNCQCKNCKEYCIKESTNLFRDKSCGCLKNTLVSCARAIDISQQKFGKLTAIQDTGKRTSSRNAIWLCQCECGNTCEVSTNNLKKLHTYSCGCIKYSIGVKNILTILNTNNISYILEYPIYNIPEVKDSHPYRFDFAIIKNDKVIRLIEYDGEQHYKETSGYMNAESLAQRQKRDQRKNQWALQHNIPLIRIPYWERDNITLDMIMGNQYLVKNKEN